MDSLCDEGPHDYGLCVCVSVCSHFWQVWVMEIGPQLSVGPLSFWLLRSWQTITTPEQWTGGGWASSSTRCLWERLLTFTSLCGSWVVPLLLSSTSVCNHRVQFFHQLLSIFKALHERVKCVTQHLCPTPPVSIPRWGWGGGIWQHCQWWRAVPSVSSSWSCLHHPEGRVSCLLLFQSHCRPSITYTDTQRSESSVAPVTR